MIRFINAAGAQNPYAYNILGVKNNHINNESCFDAKLFDFLDESLCADALTASGIDKELRQNGVLVKTLKECFAGIGGTESGIFCGKDKRFFIEHKTNSIDGNNYVFTVTYKTPANEVKIYYNTKDKITAAETWMNGEPVLSASSQFFPTENIVAENIFCPPGGAEPGCVIRQKYRKGKKEYPLTQEGMLLNARGGSVLKIFCDYGNAEDYTRYVARTIYPESPDKEETLQFTLIAAAAQKSVNGLCEARFTDKNGKEWICVFQQTTDKEMEEKYFKRDPGGFFKISVENTLLLAPYPDKIPESQEALDAVCEESFGRGFNELLPWIGRQMDFIMQKVIPAKKGPMEILEYYDIVKNYK